MKHSETELSKSPVLDAGGKTGGQPTEGSLPGPGPGLNPGLIGKKVREDTLR